MTSVLSWLEQILAERFGVQFILNFQNEQFSISLAQSSAKIILPADQKSFFASSSDLSCGLWNAQAEGFASKLQSPLPMPGAKDVAAPLVRKSSDGYEIGYDILGLTYWMLSRQEEVGRTDLDKHGRFPAKSSHAFKHNYLERPIVDEWLDILGQVIVKTWPNVKLKEHTFELRVTCDVDNPYLYYTRTFSQTCRVVLGDLLKRRNLREALLNLRRYFLKKKNNFSLDPYWQGVQWIMDVNEKIGRKVAFYFIGDHLDPYYDAYYPLHEEPLKIMLRELVRRGHEVGLHPSYRTYKDAEQTKHEAHLLRQALQIAGSPQKDIGGRQHYLRWSVATTPQNWVAAGMAYDSSLGYADRPGFRCGTCFEYPMFDPVAGVALPLRQRPLIMMEGTVMASSYLGLGVTSAALGKMLELKKICALFGGQYMMLWHNSSLGTADERRMYEQVIQ